MLIPIQWRQEGKIAKTLIVYGLIPVFIFAALVSEIPAYAGTVAYADATATWADVPSNVDSSAIGNEPSVPDQSLGHASWYVHPRYRKELMAASTQYPKGSKVRVTNLANNKSVIVTVKDWGPDPVKHPDRVIDLNKVAFSKIASTRAGVIDVRVEPLIESTSTIAINGK